MSNTYFIVRVPATATEAEIVACFAPLGVAVTDITGQAGYIAQIDRLYNGPDDEVDYEAADEIRTGVGDDLYDAFSGLVPNADGHA